AGLPCRRRSLPRPAYRPARWQGGGRPTRSGRPGGGRPPRQATSREAWYEKRCGPHADVLRWARVVLVPRSWFFLSCSGHRDTPHRLAEDFAESPPSRAACGQQSHHGGQKPVVLQRDGLKAIPDAWPRSWVNLALRWTLHGTSLPPAAYTFLL